MTMIHPHADKRLQWSDWSRALTLTLACALVAACNIDFDADVPCESDGDCPSGYACNTDFFRCVEGEFEPIDTGDDADAGDTETDTPTDVLPDTDADVPDTDVSDVPDTISDADAPDVPLDVDADPGDADVDDTDVPDSDACVFEGEEVCDGVDNDCNGVIDDPPVCGTGCATGMQLINRTDGTRFCIDRYEASRPDATADSSGEDESMSTSRENVLPWANATFAQAQAACAAADRRLCTAFEWQTACFGEANSLYPYGSRYGGDICNGSNTPPLDRPVPTGSLTECASEDGVMDLSGNLAEWAVETTSDQRFLRGGAFADPQLNLRCNSRVNDSSGSALPSYGFRCCTDAPD